MKKKLLTIILLIFTILLNGQSKIKGELINEYGAYGWAEILLNGKPTKRMNYDGKIDIQTSKKGLNEKRGGTYFRAFSTIAGISLAR